MADFTLQTGEQPRFESGHHPSDDVNVRVIVGFGVVLSLFVGACCLVLAIANRSAVTSAARARAERPPLFAINEGQYDGPRLQDNPGRDLPEKQRAAETRLESYGWIEVGKRAHIPISRAIELIAERGVAGSSASNADADDPRGAIRRARSTPN